MTIPVNQDYSEVSLSRLLTINQSKSSIEGLLTAYTTVLQETQDAAFEVMELKGLSNAKESYLDDIGLLINESRKGRDDVAYKAAIIARIRINSSQGTPKDVLDILKEYSGATRVQFFEHYPANVHLLTNGELNLDTIFDVMSSVVPVGATEVVVIQSELYKSFMGSELFDTGISLTDLVDEQGNFIVDQAGNRIQVTAAKGLYSDSAVLAELNDNGELIGLPFAEIYDKNIGS